MPRVPRSQQPTIMAVAVRGWGQLPRPSFDPQALPHNIKFLTLTWSKDILKQRTEDVDIKKYCVECLEKVSKPILFTSIQTNCAWHICLIFFLGWFIWVHKICSQRTRKKVQGRIVLFYVFQNSPQDPPSPSKCDTNNHHNNHCLCSLHSVWQQQQHKVAEVLTVTNVLEHLFLSIFDKLHNCDYKKHCFTKSPCSTLGGGGGGGANWGNILGASGWNRYNLLKPVHAFAVMCYLIHLTIICRSGGE